MHNMASSGGHLTLASLSAVAAGTPSSFQRRHHNCRNILTLNKLNSPLPRLTLAMDTWYFCGLVVFLLGSFGLTPFCCLYIYVRAHTK